MAYVVFIETEQVMTKKPYIMETPDNKQTYVVRIYEKTERRYFDVSIRAETESAALAAIHHDFPLFRYAVHSLRRGKPWTLSELLTTKK